MENQIIFTGRNVPISVIAKAMGKSPQYVRVALQRGLFNFGVLVKQSKFKTNYYCSDKKVYEEIGFFYTGKETD